MYKVALGAVLLLFIHMWVKEVLREEENNEKRKEGLLSIISTDGELQKQIDIIRKYRHDIPKHIHMMEEAIDRDIMEKRFCDNELLNAVAKIKEAECQQKNISIKIDFKLEKDAVEKINLSAIKVSGLVQNLLDNAIKFSPNQGIITMFLKQENDQVKFILEDEGPGIDEEIKNRIFDKFYQADGSHKAEGNGLGLALVKRIIDSAGGTIEAQNREYGGCRFVVQLPLQ